MSRGEKKKRWHVCGMSSTEAHFVDIVYSSKMSRFNGSKDRLAGVLNNGTRRGKCLLFLGCLLDDVYGQVVIAHPQLLLKNGEQGECMTCMLPSWQRVLSCCMELTRKEFIGRWRLVWTSSKLFPKQGSDHNSFQFYITLFWSGSNTTQAEAWK